MAIFQPLNTPVTGFATTEQVATAKREAISTSEGYADTKTTANAIITTIGDGSKISATYLPSYVDDVIDSYIVGSTPLAADWLSLTVGGVALTPENGKIYIVITSGDYVNISYRWSGSTYVSLSSPISYASQAEAEGNTENTKVMTALLTFQNWLNNVTSYSISSLNTTSKFIVGAINELKSALSGKEDTSNKDATGGYVGLTLFKINFKNVANTFTSFFTNSNTAARTYTFPDKDGTVAMTSDIPTVSGTNTGDENATRIAAINHATTVKTTLVDADEITGQDSANSFSLIRTTWTNVKAFLKTYFDTLYQVVLVSGTNIKTVGGQSLLGSGDITVAASERLITYSTTATSGASTTLDVNSNYQQYFTGSLNQTIVMPVTSTLVLGWAVKILNKSTGSLTINSSGGNAIVTIPANTDLIVTCIAITGTGSASWSFESFTGSSDSVRKISPSIINPTIQDSTDNTKQLNINISAVSSGATKTLTLPNRNVDLGNNSLSNIVFKIDGNGAIVQAGQYGGYVQEGDYRWLRSTGL